MRFDEVQGVQLLTDSLAFLEKGGTLVQGIAIFLKQVASPDFYHRPQKVLSALLKLGLCIAAVKTKKQCWCNARILSLSSQ